MDVPIVLRSDVAKRVYLKHFKVLSGNVTQNKHWSWRVGYRKRVGWMLLSSLGKATYKPCAKRLVKYVRVMGKGERKYDQNNFRWGVKIIEDLLVEYNWLYDDSEKWYSGIYEQINGEESGLHIIIYHEGVCI